MGLLKKNSKRVVFLLDHPSRDLLPSCLIGENLNYDYKIDFQDGFYPPSGSNFFERASGIDTLIVTPSYHVKRTRNIRSRSKFSNAKIVMLHSEQFLAPVSYREKFNQDCFDQFNEDVIFHLVWNDSFKKLLIDHGVSPSKIKVVGNPKFDSHKRLKKAITNKRILFISNFNAADFSEKEWAKFKKEYYLKDDDDSNIVYKKIRKNFIKSVIEVANSPFAQDFEIYVRLHPGENKSAYFELRNYKNINISIEKDLGEDLVKASMVFIYTSSVAFESFVMNRPTYAINWGELPRSLMQPPSENYQWHKPDDIISIIRHNGKFKEAISEKEFEKHFGNINESSTKLAASILNTILDRIENKNNRNWIFIFTSREGLKICIKFLLSKILITPIVPKSFKQKYIKNYLEWKKLDHYCDQKEIDEAKEKAIEILKNDYHIS